MTIHTVEIPEGSEVFGKTVSAFANFGYSAAIRELIEPKAGDRNHVAAGWKSALNALTLYFEDRITIR